MLVGARSETEMAKETLILTKGCGSSLFFGIELAIAALPCEPSSLFVRVANDELM